MDLIQFRVRKFRSVEDTGWIESSRVTALIGTNEAGKSNILLALWKLKPARDGKVDLLADAPRRSYNSIRVMENKPTFIEADFRLPYKLVQRIIALTGATADEVDVARVSRTLEPSGKLIVMFPNAQGKPTVPKIEVEELIYQIRSNLEMLQLLGKKEPQLKADMLSALEAAINITSDAPEDLDNAILVKIKQQLNQVNLELGVQKSVIVPEYKKFLIGIDKFIKTVTRQNPGNNQEARNLVWESVPSFVYYANYGNLDSEIYLPHVIENLEREDLRGVEAAKARTLRVLFEFVKLSAKEILELGKDIDPNRDPRPSDEEIHQIAEKKRERDILLSSASSDLTHKFRDWWRQGNYQFRFAADGNHFRFLVKDEIRPDELELEQRSTGLQWFLSFFLVFLVESKEAHRNTVLLLDEPGVSLHPVAQQDLFEFFNNLSDSNQIFYTAHSPFMVDADNMDRVRAVYYDEKGEDRGLTKISADLRAKEKQLSEARSVYPVHAALELSVAPVLLLGCLPVIVDGTSDQYYFSAIKTYLISRGFIKPPKEILFLPSGSFKGIKAVIPVIAGLRETLPHVVLDCDKPGRDTERQLKSSLYAGDQDRILMLADFCDVEEAEVEDLLPLNFIADVITRYLRGQQADFSDEVVPGKPVVGQVEAYAEKYGLALENNSWKVDVAKLVKERFVQRPDLLDKETEVAKRWVLLFEKFNL